MDVAIKSETMEGIADAIREKTGGTDTIAPPEMAEEIRGITAGGGNVTLDTTLSKSGYAADAAAVGAALEQKASTTEIPTIPNALKNPHQLNFTGAVTATYDGSSAVTVNIPSAGGNDGGLTIVNTDGSITAEQICNLADGAYWFASPFEQQVYSTGMAITATSNTLLVGYVVKRTVDGSRMMYCQATGYAVKFQPKTSATTSTAHAESGTKMTGWPTVSGTLPIVTASDAGKLLMVNDNGAWAATTVTNAEEVAY